MTQIALVSDEIVTALETIVRPRADAAQEFMQANSVEFVPAYLKLRFEELGVRPSVIFDQTGHSREHIYYILKGKRSLSRGAAEAISKTYPDITLAELSGIVAMSMLEEMR